MKRKSTRAIKKEVRKLANDVVLSATMAMLQVFKKSLDKHFDQTARSIDNVQDIDCEIIPNKKR